MSAGRQPRRGFTWLAVRSDVDLGGSAATFSVCFVEKEDERRGRGVS